MPRGTVATKRPPTVALRTFHSDAVGQQESPGKHLHDDDDDDDDALASALVSAETAAASKATTEKAFIAFNV